MYSTLEVVIPPRPFRSCNLQANRAFIGDVGGTDLVPNVTYVRNV